MIKFKDLAVQGKIIYITLVVFALTQLWHLLSVLMTWNGYAWQEFLALPANLNSFVRHPWTLLTYFFCHADLEQDLLHIVFNMLWLWWFSQVFLQFHKQKQLLRLYVMGGIFAGLFYLAAYNLFPYFALERQYEHVVGSSGAVMALMVAVAMQPDQLVRLNLIFRNVTCQMKWVAVVIILLSLFASNGGNTGGLICHIGGLIFGIIYGLCEQQHLDITAWVDSVERWFHDCRRPKMHATKGGKQDPIGADRRRDMNYNASRKAQEAQIDAILDKISKHGYDGLTFEEKQMLFDASKRKK